MCADGGHSTSLTVSPSQTVVSVDTFLIAVLPQSGQRHRSANGPADEVQSQLVSGCFIGAGLIAGLPSMTAIGGQCGQPILPPATFDRDVLAHDIADVAQPPTERRMSLSVTGSGFSPSGITYRTFSLAPEQAGPKAEMVW